MVLGACLPELDDNAIGLLNHLRLFRHEWALCLRHCEYEVASQVSPNFNLEAPFKEPRLDVFLGQITYAGKFDVNTNISRCLT